jgi:hypothetical protein
MFAVLLHWHMRVRRDAAGGAGAAIFNVSVGVALMAMVAMATEPPAGSL